MKQETLGEQMERINSAAEVRNDVREIVAECKLRLKEAEALLAKTVPVAREAVDSIDALRNAYANSPISPAWVRVTDARNALSEFLTTVNAGGKP